MIHSTFDISEMDLIGRLATNFINLVTLNFDYSNLGESATTIFLVLGSNPTCKLQNISMRYCKLTSKTPSAIATYLTNNNTIWYFALICSNLDLGSNTLRDEGLGPLANALENTGLKSLNISFNEIEDRITSGSSYFTQLCIAVGASKSLTKLNLGGNFIVQNGYQSILEALQTRLQLMSTNGYPGLEIIVPERIRSETFAEVQRMNTLLSSKDGKKKGGKKKK
ncbi:hypothetical protein HDV06_003447 [Boothiomyces sp. JEL0866]|nr:hypothetical protein HDV06_003447 [Boothiomyces sp. JEL0866]